MYLLVFSRINRALGLKRAAPYVVCVFLLGQTEIKRRDGLSFSRPDFFTDFLRGERGDGLF